MSGLSDHTQLFVEVVSPTFSSVLHTIPLSGRTFGSDFDPKLPSQKMGLYLNLQSPAPGDGLVIAWRYCYHDGSHLYAKEKSYSATVMLYRWTEPLSMFSLVPESKVHLSVFQPFNPSKESFTCNTTAARLRVKKGDIIGACIASQDGLYILDEGSLGHSVYAIATTSNQCLLPQNIDFSPTNSNVQFMNGTAFHVTADISERTSHNGLRALIILILLSLNTGLDSEAHSIAKKLAIPENNADTGTNLPTGAVAGIVSAVILVIAVTSIGVILVAVCMLCHKAAPKSDLDKSKVVSQNGMILSQVINACWCSTLFSL